MSDRDAILARRRRFIALALAGGTAASTAACGPCLSTDTGARDDAPITDPLDAGVDARIADATPCLSDTLRFDDVARADADPTGPDAGSVDAGQPADTDPTVDAGEPSDAGEFDAKPMPCLLFRVPDPEDP